MTRWISSRVFSSGTPFSGGVTSSLRTDCAGFVRRRDWALRDLFAIIGDPIGDFMKMFSKNIRRNIAELVGGVYGLHRSLIFLFLFLLVFLFPQFDEIQIKRKR